MIKGVPSFPFRHVLDWTSEKEDTRIRVERASVVERHLLSLIAVTDRAEWTDLGSVGKPLPQHRVVKLVCLASLNFRLQ